MINIMGNLRYLWLKLVVWYHTNFTFGDDEIQLLAIRFIRKGSINLQGCNVVADLKNWVVVIDE